ncbi:MAG: EAL domain-containing protein [Gammaproteobacteria bacterium]|nr:EAL domain-containing protein [Gammaproteobacteria bacterium]
MRFDTIFEHAPFSIQVFSPEGETILANRAWMELWRISLERIKGYNILRDPQLVEKGVMSYIQRAFSGEATVVPAIWYDAERVDPDCVPPRWVRAFIYPIMDGARITEVVIMHEDLTAQKLAEDELLKTRDELEQRVQVRTIELEKANDALRAEIAERKLAEGALFTSEERLAHFFTASYEGLLFHENGIILDINPAITELLGPAPEKIIGKHILEFVAPESLKKVIANMQAGEEGPYEVIVKRSDGSTIPAEVRAKSVEYQGRTIRVVAAQDIRERKKAEEKLRQAATVFDNTSEAIVITDAEHNIVAVNRAFSDITGYEPPEVLGKTPRTYQSGRHNKTVLTELQNSLETHGQWRGEIWNRRKSGDIYPALECVTEIKDEHGRVTNTVRVFSDISAMKESEKRLHYLAHHDALTGLPNRLLFQENLNQALRRAKRHKQRVALLFLDLDRFKIINDTLGHACGDRLLQETALRLRKAVRAEDMVARLGGDEFTIILADIAHPEDAAILAKKLIDAVAEPIVTDGHEITTSTSMGISIYPDDAEDSEDLAKAADAAMYRAKEQGRNNYQFYAAELTTKAFEHLSLEQGLRQALARDEFILHYQPQFTLKDNSLYGVEALIRWQHPKLGLVPPSKFMPVAEETGLIEPIGEWVLRTACNDAKAWHEAGLPWLRVAVNIAGRQILRGNILNTLNTIQEEAGLRPGELQLELEITESDLKVAEHSIELLRSLKSLGVTLAIDDFGTGYSSLSRLKHLPIDTLKIDRSFVRDIPHDADDVAIANAIIAMAHSLKLKVVAEGVETAEQLAFLRAQQCDIVQGYFFNKPMPADELLALLSNPAAAWEGLGWL